VEDFPVHAVIDYSPVRELKEEASACHESQGGVGMSSGIMSWILRAGGSTEIYMQAYPVPRTRGVVKDLFAADSTAVEGAERADRQKALGILLGMVVGFALFGVVFRWMTKKN
jgi:hypothetical protein